MNLLRRLMGLEGEEKLAYEQLKQARDEARKERVEAYEKLKETLEIEQQIHDLANVFGGIKPKKK